MMLSFSTQILAQVNANDQITPYTGKFRAGINPGYYGGEWNNFDLTNMGASNNAADKKIGVGVTSIRGTLPEHYGIIWDYNNWVSMYEYYKALGVEENTLVVGVAHPDHRDPVDYCASDPVETTMFANLYEPIWDGGANGTPVNDNNYMAKYVYDLVTTVGDHVKFWEVWNEPGYDLSGYKSSLLPGQPGNWWENDPDPCDIIIRAPIQNYIRTLRITYEVVKALSPDDYIVLSGIGADAFLDALMRNTDNPNGGTVTAEFPYKSGAYFDVVGFHAYPHFDGSTHFWDNDLNQMVYTRHSDGAVAGFVKRVQNRKDLLATYGYDGATYPAKLLTTTEMAVPRAPFGDFFGSDELQINYYMKVIAEAIKLGLTQTAVWQLAERNESATNSFDVMGFYTSLNGKVPGEEIKLNAGVAHGTVSEVLDGSVYSASETASLNLPSNVKGYAFQKTDGTFVYMLWAKTMTDMSETAFATYSFPGSFGNTMNARHWDYSVQKATFSVPSQNISLTGTPKFYSKPAPTGLITMNCPQGDLIEVPAPESAGGAVVTWDMPTATSTCPSGNVTITNTGGTSGDFFPFGMNVVGYTATDDCGNTARCATRVAVSSSGGINTTCRIALWDFKFAGQRDGHKYFISKFTKDYAGAVAVANSYGAKLLSIETQAENDFLQYQYVDEAYIGFSDAASEGNFTWASGAPVTYTAFDNCSYCLPNTAVNDYAVYHPWSKKWSFSDGTEQRFFMMEFDCGANPTTDLTVTSFPSNIQMTVNNGTNVNWTPPTATTTCPGGAITIAQVAGPASGSYFAANGQPVTITYLFSDNCGNTAQQSFTVTITAQGGGCPPSIAGFTALGEFNGHKYFLSNGKDTWLNNKNLAEAHNGYLATINNAAENAFIKSQISEMVHIGINDVNSEGNLEWANGDAVGYTNLSDCSWCGINDASHDFGLMLHWDGKWSFEHQWGARKFVLEVDCADTGTGDLTVNCPSDITMTAVAGTNVSWSPPTASTTCSASSNLTINQVSGPSSGSYFAVNVSPVTIGYTITDDCGNTQNCTFDVIVNEENTGGCPSTINGFTTMGDYGGHKYYLSTTPDTWANNKNFAEANGGYLAVINDASENAFIKSNIDNLVHIGFADNTIEGQVQWVNGEAMSYTNYTDCSWCGLNDEGHDFGIMMHWDGKWAFDHQWAARQSVMEMDCGATGGNMPDLTVSNITNFPASISAGSNLDFNFDLNNIGTAAVTGSYDVGTYLSVDAILSNDDVLIGNIPTGSTAIGTISGVFNSVAIPASASGSYYLILVADQGHVVTESNENNNQLSFGFTVGSGADCPTSLVGYQYLGKYAGHAYFLSNNQAPWSQAAVLANSAGGHLAKIVNQSENEFLRAQLNSYAFIGLNDDAQEGQLVWQDGSNMGFSKLDGSNNGMNDFAVMNFWNGGWTLVNQWVYKNYIVEFDCGVTIPLPVDTSVKFVTIYPNPADEFIRIVFSETIEKDVDVAIYDMYGKLIGKESRFLRKGTNAFEYDITSLNAGVYFIRFSTGHVLQFVKQR